MVIFHSYVSLPEGMLNYQRVNSGISKSVANGPMLLGACRADALAVDAEDWETM